jgi:Rrf2 family protein
MKLTTKGRYRTRMLLDLALCCGEGPIPLNDIAQRQRIPLPYLEHLISPLKAARIMKSSRGVRGGIWPVKPPQEELLPSGDTVFAAGNISDYVSSLYGLANLEIEALHPRHGFIGTKPEEDIHRAVMEESKLPSEAVITSES